MNRKKYFLLLLAAAASAAAVVAAVHLVRPAIDTFNMQLAQAASDALGMEVGFGRVGLAFTNGLELSIKSVGARKAGAEALGLQELRVRLDLAQLLKHRVRITRVTLVEPVVSLVRHKDGSFNFTGSGGTRAGKSVAITKLVVYHGSLFYTDEATGRGFEADGLDLDLNNFSYGGRRADGPLKKLFFSGAVNCAALKTKDVRLTALSLWVTAGKGVYNINPADLEINGVAAEGSLAADLSGDAPGYRLAYTTAKFRLEDTLRDFYKGNSIWKNLRGQGVLRVELAARGRTADEFKRYLTGSIRLEGKDIRLAQQNGGRDLLRADKAALALDAAALMKQDVRIKSISLTNASMFQFSAKNSGPAPARAGNASRGKPPVIESLNVSGGNYLYAVEGGSRIVEAKGVTLALKDFSYGGPAGTGAGVKFSFKGEIRCSALAAHGFTFTDVSASGDASKGFFNFSRLKAGLFSGTGGGSLKADLSGPAPAYKLAFTLHQFMIGESLSVLSGGKAGPQNMEGRMELAADISMRGKHADELRRTLTGRLALHGGKMTLPGIDVDEIISKFARSQNFNLLDVGAFLLAGPLGPAVTKSLNFADAGLAHGKNGALRELSSVWDVKDGNAVTEDVALASQKYRLAMKGGLDLADGHFDDFTVYVLDKEGCAAYSQKIQGTFAHPQIGKIKMLESLAGPVLGVLETVEKLIPFQGQCDVVYKGSVKQP